ncbi:unnamed protein product [Durusdinium trenchii]|uniref:Uncharacterized protein n=1 Tax=Durusdinium trenchii TaxID=1381693 RepID=A0ABP0SUD6_9DINO
MHGLLLALLLMNPTGGYGADSQDAVAALQAAVERLGRAHDFRALAEGRQECVRLAEELKHSQSTQQTESTGKGVKEKLLSINKVLHDELRKERLRGDSFEKCARWRLCFHPDKVAFTRAFEDLLEQSIATACGIQRQRVVVLHSCKDTAEVDFTIQAGETSAHALVEVLQSQLADERPELRTGAFAKFACSICRLSIILPSPTCLWTDESNNRDAACISLDLLQDFELQQAAYGPSEQPASEIEVSDDEADVRKRPEYWGVRVRELAQFHSSIREELLAYCSVHEMCFEPTGCVHLCKKSCTWDHSGIQHRLKEDKSGTQLLPNMHAVVAKYIKPQTKELGKSWALMRHPDGLRITHFITHTWEELFADFVASLESALDPDDVVWVCSLALDQNADIGKLLNVELSKSPFALALKRASKQLVVLDRALKVPRRSWCAYELALATRFSMPAFLWPHPNSDIEKLKAEIRSLDLRSAAASNPDDQEKICRDIEEHEGFDKLNGRYRSLLQLTLNFYSSAMSQVGALSRQIQEAVSAKDADREAQLLQLRRLELRRLEAQHSNEQRCALLQARCRSLEKELDEMRRFVRSLAKTEVEKDHCEAFDEPPVVKASSCCGPARWRRRSFDS